MDENTHLSFLDYFQLGYFSFRHLLNYVDFMDNARLRNFADRLKCRVLDKFNELDPFYREELEVLCQLTDENLTENARKIIAKRMLIILNRTSFTRKDSDPKGDCVLADDLQHNITQGDPILESLFSCRISEKDDGQSESEMKSFSIDRSHEKHVILGNFYGVRDNLKREIPDSTESCDLSFSTKGHIHAAENRNIKKEMAKNCREGYDSSFSTKGYIPADGNGNIKEMPDSIEVYDSSFSTKGCIHAGGNVKKEMPDSIEVYDSSFSTKGCIRAGGNVKKEMPDSIEIYDSSFSTKGCIRADGNVKKAMPDNIKGYIRTGGNRSIKKEIPDSTEVHDSSFSKNDCIDVSENRNSDIKEERNVPSEHTANNTHLSPTLNEPRLKRHNKSGTGAREFVSRNKKSPLKVDIDPSNKDDSTFGHFSLIDLMNYDVDLMPSSELKNYANTLKFRLLDKISEFEPTDKEELEEFCKLLDDNLTDSDKRTICTKICALVNKTIPNKPWNRKTRSTIRRYHQQANSGN